MKTLIIRLIAICVVIVAPTIVCAESLPMKATFKCDFHGFEEPLVFISNGDGTGKIIGNAGLGNLIVWQGTEIISFLEPTVVGGVHSLAISFETQEALYSRNTYSLLNSAFISAAQIKGKCRILE